jgi:prefoldin subunit 5
MNKIITVFTVLTLLSSLLFANEGMWLPSQMKNLKLKEQGLEISVDDIYNPNGVSLTDAILWLGGCSASFVSEKGLVLTNHHCAYAALQRASSQSGNDYIKNGFLADSYEEELQAIGQNAYTLLEMTDVTDVVFSKVSAIKDVVERDKAIAKLTAKMVEKIEGDREDISAKIAEMYNGKQYIQYIYKKYQDVRIVYAPPASVGKYGGDVDNWMWPRHTGDFTYLRVYMAPDGSGAKYSPDNIPVTPKNYLKIAKNPIKEGDFTFIMGYPGRTMRWRTSHSVAWNMENNYKTRIKEFGEIINLMDKLAEDDPQAKIKLANFNAGLNNAMKNYQGNLDGMEKSNFLQNKKDFEKELMKFIDSRPEFEEKYDDILDQIGEQYNLLAATKEKDGALGNFGRFAGTITSIANGAYAAAKEFAKPEDKREPGFTKKKVERDVERLQYRYLSYYEPFDKAMLIKNLKKIKSLTGKNKISALDYITQKMDIEAFVDKAYQNTQLTDPQFAKKLYFMSVSELESLNDPFLKIVAAIYDDQEKIKKRSKKFNAKITHLRKKYIEALLDWKGPGVYPDANSTLRFTFGRVEGYRPRDAVWYKPFTTLKGVVEKHTGVEPFDAPEKLALLYETQNFGDWENPALGDVPVAFTHGCDITGGNSGSAVMNAKGELIGLAFDGNYEALTGDWQFDAELQRTISVDIRYVMFITEKLAEAKHLLKEMKLR